jgi:soluble lytic murein transglycosylase
VMIIRRLRLVLVCGLLVTPGLLPLSFVSTPAFAAQDSSLSLRAVQQALSGDFMSAGQSAQRSGDEAAVKLVELLYLKDKGEKAGFSRIMDFLDRAPKWPLAETLLKKAEYALFLNHQSTQTVLAHFTTHKPTTSEGMFAFARARFESGDDKGGRDILRRAWLETDFDNIIEQQVLSEFGGSLTMNDHKARMWRLVFAQSPNAAIRTAKRIGGAYPQAAEAARYLLGGAGGAEKKLAALPASLRDAPALKYALARYYRRLEKFGKARSVLAGISADASAASDAEALWTERRIIARRSVGPHLKAYWNTAYAIAKNHGLQSGSEAVEAEFLAGWIALRYKNDSGLALQHFNKLQGMAPTRTEKSRAAYWIGRALIAQRDTGAARKAFETAAANSTVYYGQLAREHIGLGKVAEKISAPGQSSDALARVGNDEVVRAFRLVQRTGDKSTLNMFLWSLSSRFSSASDMNAVASIVNDAGGLNMSLRFAKAASQRGVDIDSWSYPLRGLPGWTHIGKPVERPLVFALSRQESEFNAQAGSKAGAQGLMQLMPGTARLIAKQYGMTYAASKLTSDPSYNVKLGAAHLADLIADYRGSYILTLVAYNAGPRRVQEWIDAYGDPRSGDIDPIDWVESIPFQETRQYVQKVLQNVHIYRSRLAPETVRPMSADLRRGGAAGVTVASTSIVEPAADCSGTSITALVKECN